MFVSQLNTDKMKLQAFKAILPDGSERIIHCNGKNRKDGQAIAANKIRFKYPETYPFIKIEYCGFVNL